MKRLSIWFALLLAVAGCEWIEPLPLPPTTPAVEQLQVIDFYATWCGPCIAQAPTIARLERDGYDIVKVNIDQNEDLAHEYNIHVVPTYVVVRGDEEIYRTNQAWKLVEYLRDVSPLQKSESVVSDVSQTGQGGAESGGGQDDRDAHGSRTRGDAVVETCLIRDRHLYLND